jgi:cell division protein FtsW
VNVRKHTSHWYSNLYTLPIILTVIGLYFVFESSSIRTFHDFGDPFFYLKRQAGWFTIGIVAMFVLSKFDYRRIIFLAMPIMFLSLILLIAVLIPGIGSKVNGARRWIDVGFTNFQPSEFVKASVIVYFSAWFQHREKKRIFAFVTLMLVVITLVMMQPDMGTAMIIGMISVGMYFLAGVDLKQLFLLIPAFVALALVTAQSASYRFQRLISLFDIDHDPQGIGYHVRQIVIAFQNGGLLGAGLGASKQKYLYLPEAHTDSIFAIYVEEMGLVGAIGLIFLLFLLIYYLYRAVAQAHDRFGFMLGSGIFLYFSLQSIINLASMTRLMPLTGVPLPFISYGGTSLFVSYSLIGIMISIASKKYENELNIKRVLKNS